MATLDCPVAGRTALLSLTVIAALTTCPITGNALPPVSAAANQPAGSDDQTPQPAGNSKSETESAPPSDKPAVDPNTVVPPADANADARELVRRRMELCRLRPALCVQGADQQGTGNPAKRDDPSKNK